LGWPNQPFSGFFCFQWLTADFVSPRSHACFPRFGLPERQTLARNVEATEPLLHLVDLAANLLKCALEAQQPLGWRG
jgi:hypothetical protein